MDFVDVGTAVDSFGEITDDEDDEEFNLKPFESPEGAAFHLRWWEKLHVFGHWLVALYVLCGMMIVCALVQFCVSIAMVNPRAVTVECGDGKGTVTTHVDSGGRAVANFVFAFLEMCAGTVLLLILVKRRILIT